MKFAHYARKALDLMAEGILKSGNDHDIRKRSRIHMTTQVRDVMAHTDGWKKLSETQKKEITALWHTDSDFYTHEIMMNVKGAFDVRYCPHSIFRLYLDDRKDLWPWIDKNYFERHQPGLKFPHTVVRCVDGHFLDHDYRPLSREQALETIEARLPLIIKPSIDSGEGKHLKLLSAADQAREVLASYPVKDFLLQEVVIQCDELKKMSPKSVASYRIITALVGDRVKVLSSHLLCNTTDSVAVNHNTAPGVGVVIVKSDEDGRLADFGYFENALKIDTLPWGFRFGGLQIPSYRKAVEQAVKAHESVPMLRFVGWDITIDENHEPVFIEWNQRGIEVYHSQLTNGPLFGDDTEYFASLIKK